MAIITKYVYQHLITIDGDRPNMYKHNDTLYAVFTITQQQNSWIDLYISDDDGETWTVEDSMPIYEYKLYDARVCVVEDTIYIFAYGYSAQQDADAIMYIRRTTDNSDETHPKFVWDRAWKEIVGAANKHTHLTDLCLDDNNMFVHIMYDQMSDSGKYAVHYGAISLLTLHQDCDVVLHNVPYANQHNGKLKLINGTTFGIVWQEEQYNGICDIKYTQYDVLRQEQTDILTLSNDKTHNSYHPTITVNSAYDVFVVWLNTQDNYATDSLQYTYIVDMINGAPQTISTHAQTAEYPYLICDTADTLYVLYNKGDVSIQYMKKPYVADYSENNWIAVTNLDKNNWQMLCGYCWDENLYTIVSQDNKQFLVTIDTALAEVFAPVSDLQIASMTDKNITVAWTPARNAQKIYLEQIAPDTWANITTIEPISPTDESAIGINIPAGRVKLRLKYQLADMSWAFLPIGKQFTNEKKQNIPIYWHAPSDCIKQVLEYTVETWQIIAEIPNTSCVYTADYDGRITRYRLKIIGGVAEGNSNEVYPLTGTLDGDSIHFAWMGIPNAKDIQLQQSIDGYIWYAAKTDTPLMSTDNHCTVSHLQNVVYRYRLLIVGDNTHNQLSNVVTINNTLRLLEVGYKSARIQWVAVEAEEIYDIETSINHGISWNKAMVSASNFVGYVSKLKYDTDYLMRICYPHRVTGKYSNVLTFHTNKKPIDDLTVTANTCDSVSLKCSMYDETWGDIEIHIHDVINDTETTCMMSNYNHHTEESKAKYYEITCTVTNLSAGHEYDIYMTPTNSHYGGKSNVVHIALEGYKPQNLKVVSVSKHSVTLSWNKLQDITKQKVATFVRLSYSYDLGAHWQEYEVSTLKQCTINGLMQNTAYKFRLECGFGYNKGTSDIVEATTQADSFAPVYGSIIPNERAFVFCKEDKTFYILNAGILYAYNKTTKRQSIVCDYHIINNNVYSAITLDKNDKIHLVICCGKSVYYATNCDEPTTDGGIIHHDISHIQEIVHDESVNEYINPDIKISDTNNRCVIAYEMDCGHYSDVGLICMRNGAVYQQNKTIIANGMYNHTPKVAIKYDGGWYVAALSEQNEHCMCVVQTMNNYDYHSEYYLQEKLFSDIIDLKDMYSEGYNNFSIAADNMGGLRILYYSKNDNKITNTYGLYDNKCKYTVQNVYANDIVDNKIIINDNLILLGRRDTEVLGARYLAHDKAFTDLQRFNVSVDNNPLTVCNDDDNIYFLCYKAGMFDVGTVPIKQIVDNKYVKGIWIDNEFSVQNDNEDYVVHIWTTGDIHDYPLLCLQCNNIIKEITPIDKYGYATEKDIVVNDLVSINVAANTDEYIGRYIKPNTKSMVLITYNVDKKIVVDLTNMLYYMWDNTKIINAASDSQAQ